MGTACFLVSRHPQANGEMPTVTMTYRKRTVEMQQGWREGSSKDPPNTEHGTPDQVPERSCTYWTQNPRSHSMAGQSGYLLVQGEHHYHSGLNDKGSNGCLTLLKVQALCSTLWKITACWWRSFLPDMGNHVPVNHSTPHSQCFSSHMSYYFQLGVDKTKLFTNA